MVRLQLRKFELRVIGNGLDNLAMAASRPTSDFDVLKVHVMIGNGLEDYTGSQLRQLVRNLSQFLMHFMHFTAEFFSGLVLKLVCYMVPISTHPLEELKELVL